MWFFALKRAVSGGLVGFWGTGDRADEDKDAAAAAAAAAGSSTGPKKRPSAKLSEDDSYCNPVWHKASHAWTVKYRKSDKQALSVPWRRASGSHVCFSSDSCLLLLPIQNWNPTILVL